MKYFMAVDVGGKKEGIEESEVRIAVYSDCFKELNLNRGDILKLTIHGKTIYRELKMGSVPKNTLRMRYDTMLKLGLKRMDKDEEVEFDIEKAGWFGKLLYLWHHPDPSLRISVRYGTYLFLASWVISLIPSVIGGSK